MQRSSPAIQQQQQPQQQQQHPAAIAVPSSSSSSSSSGQQSKRKCKCKNSRCLKLYCECFLNRHFCDGCECLGCRNQESNSEDVARAVTAILERNPAAFAPRSKAAGIISNKGCKCRKSSCLKKVRRSFSLSRPLFHTSPPVLTKSLSKSTANVSNMGRNAERNVNASAVGTGTLTLLEVEDNRERQPQRTTIHRRRRGLAGSPKRHSRPPLTPLHCNSSKNSRRRQQQQLRRLRKEERRRSRQRKRRRNRHRNSSTAMSTTMVGWPLPEMTSNSKTNRSMFR